MNKKEKKNPGRTGFKKNRYRGDYVDTVHFNHNGKKSCHTNVTNPQWSIDPREVTCRFCRNYLEKL